MSDESRRAQLKEAFIRERGYWNSVWSDLLEDDPDYFEAYLRFSAAPWRHGTLSPKVKEFCYIAIDASATHLFKPGLVIHLQNAIAHGATAAEVLEVLELTSEIGIHSCTAGVPIVMEEARRAGVAPSLPDTGSPELAALKRRFVERVGEWNDTWETLLALAPEFFAAWVGLASVPRGTTRLDPRTRELVLLAASAATTNLYEAGIRTHARNALRLGATVAELLEVLQLVSVLGIHALTLGLPASRAEFKRRQDAAAG